MNIRLNQKAAAFAGGVVSMACHDVELFWKKSKRPKPQSGLSTEGKIVSWKICNSPQGYTKVQLMGGGITYLQQISITIIYAFSAEVDHFRKEKLIHVTLLL